MEKIRTILVDDEANTIEVLQLILKKRCPQVNVIGTAQSVREAKEVITNLSPDLVLLDINLGDGSGFDLLQQFHAIPFSLIFITAYEEFAIRAFKFSALDYLLKPINSDDLVKAIERVKLSSSKSDHSEWQNFLSNNQLSSQQDRKIILKTHDSIYAPTLSSIVRCEADTYYTKFFLENKQQIMVSNPLKYYDEMLCDSGFFRIHQSHLINLSYFIQFKKSEGGTVVLKDQSELPLSQRKKELFLRAIENL